MLHPPFARTAALPPFGKRAQTQAHDILYKLFIEKLCKDAIL